MVPTITESCFRKHFEQGVKTCQWLQLRAANGLEIPYSGYIEMDVKLCGKLVPKCGVLVVKDPPVGLNTQVLGVLGMTILWRCYQELFGQHGPALFSLPSVSEAQSIMVQALQHCCQVSTQPVQDRAGKVRVLVIARDGKISKTDLHNYI